MVSTRPSPNPARRVHYPTADTYVPGDEDSEPVLIGSPAPIGSPALIGTPVHRVTSGDSDSDKVQNLKAWWKAFKGAAAREAASGVFEIPLAESLSRASVQISTRGPDGRLRVWGSIPVVVAKCGLYLKQNSTEVEGTFRVSGSAKRTRELQAVFDEAPGYGREINWEKTTFTTHDVATIFRRFLTLMPEPIVPLSLYHDFRGALTVDDPVARYKDLIRSMPPANQHLLLYVLDVLHLFAGRSDKNLMTAANLALIFQPGVISHPHHIMHPREHVLSRHVVEYLIEHQDHFAIGMTLTRGGTRTSSPPTAGPSSPALSPPLIRADADLMVPSDSDDEAPADGYYVVERPTSPAARAEPARSPPALALNLIPPPPRRPSSRTTPDVMEASDSDEEAPPGGYEVRVSDPAQGRAALLARSKTQTRTSPASTEASLSRRRTVPSRRPGAPGARARRSVKEAP